MQWFIKRSDGSAAGPISFEDLYQLAKRGRIQPDTDVCKGKNGTADRRWKSAESIENLFPPPKPVVQFHAEIDSGDIAE